MLRSYIFGALVVGVALVQNALAQAVPAAGAPAMLSPGALQSLVSGIALYPDPIVQQILDASQYPGEIHSAITGQAPAPQGYGASSELPPSVVALQEHPEILTNLDQHSQMTTSLGIAYQNQPQDVWNAIQAVRGQIDQNVASQSSAPATTTNNVYAGPAYPNNVYPSGGYPNGAGYLAASGAVAQGLLRPNTSYELNSYYGAQRAAYGASGYRGAAGAGNIYGPNPAAAAAVDRYPITTKTGAVGGQVDSGAAVVDGQRTYSAGDQRSVAGYQAAAGGAQRTATSYAHVNQDQISTANKAFSQNWGQLHQHLGSNQTANPRGDNGRQDNGRQFENRSQNRSPERQPDGQRSPGRGEGGQRGEGGERGERGRR